ncbi:Variant SH3 domain [Carpediemonas membranifera]|uniref:Variant SH3 domain n=1 Tax=Carpediemonas membranifera TaxID=201153 RepID=A0A8J6B210_9EUKA|nr:Variant SH3 domain [Carpediemonas membranifera]|eukprot:KAG9391307.1 Variant SH3 domain [Carpediemonas membranifera]
MLEEFEKAVAEAASAHPWKLDVSCLGLTDEIAPFLITALSESSELRVLNISGNYFTDRAFRDILASLYHTDLEELHVRFNNITQQSSRLIVSSLPKLPALQSLSLSGNPLGQSFFAEFGNAVLSKLSHIDLFGCEVGNCTSDLLLVLADMPHLRSVNLWGTSLRADALLAKLFSPTAICAISLRTVNVGNNPLGDLGVRYIASGLKVHTNVERVDLGHCGITDDSVDALVSVIAAGHLKALNLKANSLSEEATAELSSVSRTCRVVTLQNKPRPPVQQTMPVPRLSQSGSPASSARVMASSTNSFSSTRQQSFALTTPISRRPVQPVPVPTTVLGPAPVLDETPRSPGPLVAPTTRPIAVARPSAPLPPRLPTSPAPSTEPANRLMEPGKPEVDQTSKPSRPPRHTVSSLSIEEPAKPDAVPGTSPLSKPGNDSALNCGPESDSDSDQVSATRLQVEAELTQSEEEDLAGLVDTSDFESSPNPSPLTSKENRDQNWRENADDETEPLEEAITPVSCHPSDAEDPESDEPDLLEHVLGTPGRDDGSFISDVASVDDMDDHRAAVLEAAEPETEHDSGSQGSSPYQSDQDEDQDDTDGDECDQPTPSRWQIVEYADDSTTVTRDTDPYEASTVSASEGEMDHYVTDVMAGVDIPGITTPLAKTAAPARTHTRVTRTPPALSVTDKPAISAVEKRLVDRALNQGRAAFSLKMDEGTIIRVELDITSSDITVWRRKGIQGRRRAVLHRFKFKPGIVLRDLPGKRFSLFMTDRTTPMIFSSSKKPVIFNALVGFVEKWADSVKTPETVQIRQPDSRVPKFVQARFDFVTADSRMLSLKRGDSVRVTGEADQWLYGETEDGRRGFFPPAYMEMGTVGDC